MHSFSKSIFTLAALSILIFTGLVGCSDDIITDQKIKMISVEKLTELTADPEFVLIDVRNAKKYAAGHIPNAVHIHLPQIKVRMKELATAKYVVVYSGGWTDRLGSAAVKKMLKLGYKNVSELRGGIEVWEDSGRKLIKPKAAPTPPIPTPAPAKKP